MPPVERPNDGQYVALLSEFKGDGTMNYHGLIFNFQRRAAKGVSFSGNYTWSHCVGDRTDFNGSGPNPGQDDWMIDNNRRGDRGNCDSDRRHVLSGAGRRGTPRCRQLLPVDYRPGRRHVGLRRQPDHGGRGTDPRHGTGIAARSAWLCLGRSSASAELAGLRGAFKGTPTP